MTLLEEITIRYRHEIYDAHYLYLMLNYAKRNKMFSKEGQSSLAVKYYEHNYCASILKPMLEKHLDDDHIHKIIEEASAEAYANYKKLVRERRNEK